MPMIYSFGMKESKNYELVVVLDGKATAAKKKALSEKIAKMVNVLSGKIVSETDWGVRELAYEINDLKTGLYLIFELELPAAGAKSLNDKLHLEEEIIRYLLVTKEKALVRIKNRAKVVAAPIEIKE